MLGPCCQTRTRTVGVSQCNPSSIYHLPLFPPEHCEQQASADGACANACHHLQQSSPWPCCLLAVSRPSSSDVLCCATSPTTSRVNEAWPKCMSSHRHLFRPYTAAVEPISDAAQDHIWASPPSKKKKKPVEKTRTYAQCG